MNVNIGKNTLGDTGKMTLSLREYGRSTHNLSYAWRSTMGVGALTPFMRIVGLPGDTFEIDLENKILTNPTLGALFGSYKFQADIFTCPIRLYNAMLHNNHIGIGMDMKKVKLPKLKLYSYNAYRQMEPSNLFEFLKEGIGRKDGTIFNAVPTLAYYDIFKNYYANKQEDKFPMYAGIKVANEGEVTITGKVVEKVNPFTGGLTSYLEITSTKKVSEIQNMSLGIYDEYGKLYITTVKNMSQATLVEGTTEYIAYYRNSLRNTVPLTLEAVSDYYQRIPEGGNLQNRVRPVNSTTATFSEGESQRKIELFNLEEIDNLREYILSKGKQEVVIDNTIEIPFIRNAISGDTTREKLGGLVLKTYQSDIFTNWIKTEWIEGENGISKLTSIDTSSGSFSIDTLNLAKKVYEMLNRIAISGGTYKDWIETVYTTDYYFRAETPVYEGGMSSEIEFQEIVSNSASEASGYEPLGTLAGRGVNTNKKGGKIVIKVNEPCYIMGIASITPRVDYSYFQAWDASLDTLDDLHKPQLDGIGYQDLIEQDMYVWGKSNRTIGKQPAWIQYTTAVNESHGEFSKYGNQSYMVLNRPFIMSDDSSKIANPSSYIEPELFNSIFATEGPQEQHFQVQIGCRIEARRVMSARQIPNF